MADDYAQTLEKLAGMGYKYIEGGSYGDDAKAYFKLAKSLGLKTIIGGSSMSGLQKELPKYLEQANELRQKYITCYWPWMSDAKSITKEECLEAAERLNKMGRLIKQAGFKFTWHNHDKEFVDIQGKTAFDWLVQETDAAYVNVQMDTYWVAKGNHDPIALMKKYPGRIKLLHLKDITPQAKEDMTCVGSGNIDFQAVYDLMDQAGVEIATVENERTKTGLACAQSSIDHLKTIGS